ncbi:non-hydrolyzing UDP-N-acetylglucosamine 2-epimerase [Brevibacterium yomogidense]|uniref:non-hydrolyzing UDP-N-acetylglucosamine 2-epimerase n=1 Tax=Brevibacterium yomogidense TaxID=946573 RepID=UPI0018E031A4|nr:UDP-N-acetylglucosamine 2-epimerase (non-hydrolyzing) [Brevibacterium yomogidense]
MPEKYKHNPVIMVVYGTRPEAIKVAPVVRGLTAATDLDVSTVVTAQHREMLDQVNADFEIIPDFDLNVMSPGQTLNQISSRVISGMDELYAATNPDAVLVQGDTTTVSAAAIAAFNRKLPVIHLEAGLRSGDIQSPFPEEANRRIVSQLASLHLAPTNKSMDNLLREGIDARDVVVTGNTVIDSLKWAAGRRAKFTDPMLLSLTNSDTRVLLLTTHRRENLGSNMESVGRAVRNLSIRYPDLVTVWPAHKNPQIRRAIKPMFDGLPNVLTIEPVAYTEFAHLIARSDIVLTDSGGIQEEAPSLGKPVLVLRENTERPEAVEAGAVELIGTNEKRIVDRVSQLLDDPLEYARMANAVNPYGDGYAAEYAIDAIRALVSKR